MTNKIRFTEPQVKRIIDTTLSTVRPLDPDEIARVLGAEPTSVTIPTTLGPITRYVVRKELFERLQSTGDRPALEGNTLPPKIPLSDRDWRKLEELATQIAASTGLSPSPEQVGSALLSLALRSLAAEANDNGGSEGTAGLVSELAARRVS